MTAWLQPVAMTGTHARLAPLERDHVPALAEAVRDGHNLVIDALKGSKQSGAIIASAHFLNTGLVYPYVPIEKATMV